MARTTPGVTRQRIIEEAARLFSSQGYTATSVADIQLACGLTGGSGALYKHFGSKQAVLEAIVAQHLESIADGRRDLDPVIPDDTRAALELVGRAIWATMEHNRDALRIIFRDLDQFPDLLDEMWQGVVGGLYQGAAEWIRQGVAAGRMTVADPDATASVLLASLTYYQILNAVIGRTPGDVGKEEFFAAWVDHAVTTLQA